MDRITAGGITPQDLLPHRDGMLLVKEILEVDSSRARALFQVDPSWPMADELGVHPLIMVELAAQTAGICNGWDRVRTRGADSNAMGWLVGVKKTEFLIESLPFGTVIIGIAENTFSFGNLREVSCELYLDERLIGRAVLQLYQAE